MSKIEKTVNEVAGKTSWNYQNHQSGQPKQGKGKLELSKSSKRSTEARKRQAGIIEIIKAVNQSKKKTS